MEEQFHLYSNTEILFNGKKEPPIINAIAILQRDMEKILKPFSQPAGSIMIEPLDSGLPDESWRIIVTTDQMLLQYCGTLGCVYALLFISGHFLHVTPFWFWNDQQCTMKDTIPVPAGVYHSPEYAVRFRGWFINDEVLIDHWKTGQDEEHWRMVFEALLRCGGNLTIPGTDSNSRKYRDLAAAMGLWITHHHAEPLGAEMFSRSYPDKIPSYTLNKKLFEDLWEQAVIEQKDNRVIWNIGFRGQGDRPFWDDDPECAAAEQRGKRINAVIAKQWEIIRRYVQKPVCCINIYGEMAELYRGGLLDIPSGIIKIWADNGYGRMVSRRQGNSNPRIYSLPDPRDKGSHGIYYHCSFHDLQASNHLTMSPNTAEFMTAELDMALAAGADECWIVNCGSVKPHVHSLDLLRALWQAGNINVYEWRKCYAQTYYGEDRKEDVAALFAEYASCTARYGIHEDDHAGEQLWHHPVRELLCGMMQRRLDAGLESLFWLTGNVPCAEQAAALKNIAAETLPRWEVFCKKCLSLRPSLPENSRQLFTDSLLLHGLLHLHGAAGTKAFCESFLAGISGDTVSAFRFAAEAHVHYKASVTLLEEAEHGQWTGYYDGDCLTDVRLTFSCLDALLSYFRVVGDGPSFHTWEKDFLVPESERNVALLNCKQRALTNEELAGKLPPLYSQTNKNYLTISDLSFSEIKN